MMHSKYDGSERFEEFAALQFDLEGNDLLTLLKYQKENLNKPLLNLKPSMKYRALKANKLIVDFMSLRSQDEIERHSEGEISESDIQRILSLVNLGCCNRSEDVELRDEIYCQLVKQTTSNLVRISCCRGVELFLSCLAGFPPSQLLTPYLHAHFHAGFVERAYASRQTAKLAENCIRALEKINKYGPRRQGITRNEIIAILSRNECLSIKIWLTNEISMDINIDSWTSMGDLKHAICEKVGIADSSTLTIAAVLNSSNESERQEEKVMLASSKGLMHSLFNQLFLEMEEQSSNQQDVRSRWHPICGGIKDIETSSKTIFALNSFIKLDLERGVNSPDLFTTSHSCLTNDDFHTENAFQSSVLQTGFFCLPLLCPQSVGNGISAMDFSNIDLKLKLRIWIFPDVSDESGMSPTRSAVSFALPQDEDVETNSSIDTSSQKLFMKDFFKSDFYAKKTETIDNSSERINSDHWPYDDFMRNILYNQLLSDVVDGSLMCSDDIESLYLAALALGEQNQSRNWCCQERPYFFDEISGIDKDDILRKILPAILINMPLHRRVNAADSISKEMMALVADTERVLKGLQERSGWVAFLYSSVVCLWSLYFEDLTSRECRNLYLRGVRECTGYGSTVFFPSAAKLSVLKDSEKLERIEKEGKGANADEIIDAKQIVGKKHRWVIIENEYKSHNNCTSLIMDQQERVLLESTIMLSVVTEGLVLSECTKKPSNVIHDSLNNEIGQRSIDTTTSKVLLKIKFDEIVSWGYSDELLVIKFRGRDRCQGRCSCDYKESKQDTKIQVRNKEDSDKPFNTLFNDIMTCAYGEEKDEGNQQERFRSDSISKLPTLCQNEFSNQVERTICRTRCGDDEKDEKQRNILRNEGGSQHEVMDVGRIRGGTSTKNQRNYSTSSAFIHDFSSVESASHETKEEKKVIDCDSVVSKIFGEDRKNERHKRTQVLHKEMRGIKVQRRRLEEIQRKEGKKVEGKSLGDSGRSDSVTLTTSEGIEIAELLQLYVSQSDLMKRRITLKK